MARHGIAQRLILLVAALAFAALLLWPGELARAQAARPNVVLFLTDDQRYDQLDYMPIVQRELVNRGVNFSAAVATTPLCCPSRASILTGLYPHHHGVVANSGDRGGWRRFDDTSTLATWLQAAGVRTMLIGKYLNLYKSLRIPPGWDGWFALWDTGLKYYDYTVNNNGKIREYGDKEKWYSADVLTRRALEFLAEDRDRPFFLYLAFDGPHAPPTPAEQDRHAFDDVPPHRLPSYNEDDVSDKPSWVQELPPLDPAQQADLDQFWRDQLATLQSIDRAVGAVVDALRADGRLDNTWLIFMSDNGLSLGEHRYGRHKSCGYEECIRLPLVIVPPASLAAAAGVPRVDGHVVANIDIAPTIVEALGIAPARPMDGLSLVPLITGAATEWRGEVGLELVSDDEQIGFQGLRGEGWKYLRYANGEQELYDLTTDPYELDNLAGRPEQADRLQELSARLDALMR